VWHHYHGPVDPSGKAVVALLDTGVDAAHPDLAGKLVPGASFVEGADPNVDSYGHGTWLAGIVAAETDNSLGIAGIGYEGVEIMPVTVLGSDGFGYYSDIVRGVVYAAAAAANVLIMAFSNPGYSAGLQAAIDYAWSKGAVLVAANGNDGSSAPTYPAGDRGVMRVSNTTPTDGLAPDSNYGSDTFLGAPGTEIVTTAPGDTYTSMTGTSA